MTPLELKAIALDFARAARAFCALLESPPPSPREPRALDRALLQLHIAALSLPEVEPDAAALDPEVSPSAIDVGWIACLPAGIYWDVFDPFTCSPEEPVANSPVDDLKDVYCEVKRGLMIFDAGMERDAVWQWRFSFTYHWGEHMVGLVRALHLADRALPSGRPG